MAIISILSSTLYNISRDVISRISFCAAPGLSPVVSELTSSDYEREGIESEPAFVHTFVLYYMSDPVSRA